MEKTVQRLNFDGKITILFSEDGLEIQLHDEKSSITFAEVKLNPEQTCQALSRLAYTPCTMTLRGLDRVGKKMLMDTLTVEIPDRWHKDRKEIACREALAKCPAGWEPDNYFGSKNSFFSKDGKDYAQTIIRRWE